LDPLSVKYALELQSQFLGNKVLLYNNAVYSYHILLSSTFGRERERKEIVREERKIEDKEREKRVKEKRDRGSEREREVVGGQKELIFGYRDVIQITSRRGQRDFGDFPATDMLTGT
jgi:hypothetical protein